MDFVPDKGLAEVIFSQPVGRGTILIGRALGVFQALVAAQGVGFDAAGIVIFDVAALSDLPRSASFGTPLRNLLDIPTNGYKRPKWSFVFCGGPRGHCGGRAMKTRAGRFQIGLGSILSILAFALPALGGPISGSKWYSIGPAPSFQFFPGGETGRTTSIAVNPANPDDIWIGTAGGGVWHSSSGGSLWFPVSDNEASLAIGSIALAGCSSTGGCSYVYAGTGENAIRRDTYYGAGLLVGSTDTGGFRWSLRDGKPTYDFTHGSIYNVVLDPTTAGASQVIYITLSSGVTASASESTVTAPAPYPGGYGIFRSADNGLTWTKLDIPGSGAGSRPTDLEMDRTNSSILYAGFLGRGIFKSVDGGANWCPLDPGIPKPLGCPLTYGLPNPATSSFDHVEIDIYRGDHNHLYATFGNCPDPLLNDCEPSVFESTDGGIHWVQRYYGASYPASGDLYCPRAYTRYMHALTISPSSPATLYLGGYHLCESLNNGQSWFAIDDTNTKGNSTIGHMLHPDHHAIVFHETSFSRVYDVNDGGVALSSDGGASWTPSTGGLDAIEFQSLAATDATPTIFGGTQDNAGVAWNGTKQWDHLACCGDGGFAAFETYNVGGFYDTTNMYITSNMGGVGTTVVQPARSTNWGATWPWPGVPPVTYDIGLDPSEPRSFYPPLVNGGGYDSFGTNRLYTSVDQISDFNVKSPVFSTLPEPEIYGGRDVVTAIAPAPTVLNRFYLGLYSGQVWTTTSPCSTIACWTQVASPSPGAPVTWIAVDPSDAGTAYATVSGFGSSTHVFKTTSGGSSWSPICALAELNGVPANTVAIDPGSSSTIYVGTDKGIYRSDNGGGSCYRFSSGLPNVPVYAFAFDPSRNRIFAATHGRGAYMLGRAWTRTFVKGPIYKRVLDQPAFGGGYRANQPCTVKIRLQDGSVCASGGTDALGGSIQTDAEGNLVSTKASFFTNLPVVWTCAQPYPLPLANCLGTDARACMLAGNPIGSIEVSCGGETANAIKPPNPSTPNPPTSLFTVGGSTGGTMGSGGMFMLVPTIQTGDGSSRVLCSVNVPFVAADTQGTVLQNAGAMVNSDPGCRTSGVSAMVEAPATTGAVEDIFPHPGHLSLQAASVSGGTLIPSVRTAPGQATGICFTGGKLDDPLRGAIRGMKLQFATGPGGGSGGTISVTERSPLGECTIPVAIPAGSMPGAVASAIAAAFQAPGIPSPFAGCPTSSNPRDLVAQGDSVLTALASELVVCVGDPGVGFSMLPAEICTTNADCDDANPCTLDTCVASTGTCQSTPAPAGQICDDGDPCTVGNTCQNGTCGVPVVCNDNNSCTSDTCDPATGGCAFTPIVCDDGNPCTGDFCDPAAGGCVFPPLPGTVCSTGDPCTVNEICVQSPGNPVPTCQGQPKCDDGSPCTSDLCDPATGACLNAPIVCDDGNPCTADFCEGGVCFSSAVAGNTCDDGNRCTIGDSCVPSASGPPVCQGQPVNCDDNNACTVDSCDPVTGGCLHTPTSMAEVPGLVFTSKTAMTWSPVPAASFFDTYRGTIPAGGFGSRPPTDPLYDQACFEFGDSHGDGAMISIDTAIPPAGTGFYYLVSEVAPCGEGPIGSDGNGTVIPNSSPCPLP